MQLAALCLASLALLSRSITVAALPGAVVDKRDIEINYLVNCQAPYKVSHIAWYSNLNNSQAQQVSRILLTHRDNNSHLCHVDPRLALPRVPRLVERRFVVAISHHLHPEPMYLLNL